MDKERLITKTQQILSPFETQNVIAFMKELSTKTITDNPKVTFLLFLVFLYSLWRWSRFMLLFLFTLLSFTLLIRYTLPPAGTELTVRTTFPFAFGSFGIGAEISSTVAELAFDYLDAPIRRVAQAEVPLPYNKRLEQLALPQVDDVIKAAKDVLYLK